MVVRVGSEHNLQDTFPLALVRRGSQLEPNVRLGNRLSLLVSEWQKGVSCKVLEEVVKMVAEIKS
jgi:hypothetical protein